MGLMSAAAVARSISYLHFGLESCPVPSLSFVTDLEAFVGFINKESDPTDAKHEVKACRFHCIERVSHFLIP